MTTVFFSYSHADENLRDRLEVHLSALKRQGAIEAWHDRRIKAGDNLTGAIHKELERADIILLLVSPDFINSDYCYDVEMKRALERHEADDARVIPIILRHCDWHSTPFGKLLAAPKDGKPIQSWPDLDEAFLDVVKAIRAALPTRASPRVSSQARETRATVSEIGPRSSNLRLKKTFSDADRDRFLDDAFEFMARFFENSLEETKARNTGIEFGFRRIDANRFTAILYREGKAVARCKIVLGGMFGKGITFSHNDQASDGSMNENLSVEADDQGLYFKALGFAHFGREKEEHLTFEGAAEYYWSMFIERLQQT